MSPHLIYWIRVTAICQVEGTIALRSGHAPYLQQLLQRSRRLKYSSVIWRAEAGTLSGTIHPLHYCIQTFALESLLHLWIYSTFSLFRHVKRRKDNKERVSFKKFLINWFFFIYNITFLNSNQIYYDSFTFLTVFHNEYLVTLNILNPSNFELINSLFHFGKIYFFLVELIFFRISLVYFCYGRYLLDQPH